MTRQRCGWCSKYRASPPSRIAAEAEAVRGGKRAVDRVREDVRLAVRKIATRWTGKKPIVDVLLIQA